MKEIDKSNELIQYYIVNKDLGMSSGKISAQVGHVVRRISDWFNNTASQSELDKYNRWINEFSEKKIVLEAHQKTLEKLVDKGFFYVKDNGLTEIAPGSLTVVGLGVMTREEAKPFVKRLQTLK